VLTARLLGVRVRASAEHTFVRWKLLWTRSAYCQTPPFDDREITAQYPSKTLGIPPLFLFHGRFESMTSTMPIRGPGRPVGDRDTRNLILDEAEKLFAYQGYASTSTRMIAAAAGVQQSMISYYFGSKQKLFEDVFRRRGTLLSEQRTQYLDGLLQRTDGHPSVHEIVAAYLKPQFDLKRSGAAGLAFMRLQARLHNEPEELAFRLRREVYDPSSKRYIAVLEALLPHIDPADLNWRFTFLIGAYLYMLSGVDRLHDLSDGRYESDDLNELVAQLTHFLATGMQAESTPQSVRQLTHS